MQVDEIYSIMNYYNDSVFRIQNFKLACQIIDISDVTIL